MATLQSVEATLLLSELEQQVLVAPLVLPVTLPSTPANSPSLVQLVIPLSLARWHSLVQRTSLHHFLLQEQVHSPTAMASLSEMISRQVHQTFLDKLVWFLRETMHSQPPLRRQHKVAVSTTSCHQMLEVTTMF